MEKEIINTALNNLRKNIEINAKWLEDHPLDGIIVLNMNNINIECTVEIKKELRQHQVSEIEQLHKTYMNFLLVAENIFPKIKKQFRDLGIAYLEANGNIFIKNSFFYVFIDTNKPHTIQKQKSNRAFTKTGLKVVFQFLINKNLINKTHREIAEQTNVGLGNIPQIINGLKDTGYIISLHKKKYLWENKKELIDRWINDYATKLRPKIVKGKYRVSQNWQELKLNTKTTVWGGEPAADLLTNYLRPEKYILYSKETSVELIKNYKLFPDKNGDIEVLDIFWKHQKNEKIAPPLLIYTELMVEGGKRNEELAKIIFNEFIEQNI